MAENNLTTLAKRIKALIVADIQAVIGAGEGPGIDIAGSNIGLGGDTILLYKSNGDPVAEYAASDAGLTAALNAAASGNVVLLPAGTISGDHTIPAGVTVLGMSRESCILTGKVTLGAGSALVNLSVTRTANDANLLYAIIGPASGTAEIYSCRLTCVQSGSGNTAVIAIQDGDLITHDCYINGTSIGGLGNEFAKEGSGNWTSLHDDFSDVDMSEIGERTEYHFPADAEGWTADLGGDANASSEWDSDVGHDAVGSLHITRTGGGGETFPTHSWTKAIVGLTAKTGDSLSVWIKHDNPYMSPIFNVRITYVDASYDEDFWHPEHAFDWTLRSVAVSAANNGKSISSIRVSETMGGWDYRYTFETWWDDIVLTSYSGFDSVGSKFPSGPFGIPAPYSDRAAWDAINYGEKHASDWDDGDSHHPVVSLTDEFEEVFALDNQELDLKTQAANTVLAGPTSGADAAPAFRELAPVDIPVDLIALEDLENFIESGEAVGDILQITDWMEKADGTESLYDSALLTHSGSGDSGSLWDGDKTAQWISNSPGPHYELFSFSRKFFVSKIVVTANKGIWMGADYPHGVEFYGSDTGAFGGEETLLASSGNVGQGIYTLTNDAPRTGYRYYKIIFIRAGATCRVNEVEVYTMPDAPVWANKTLAGAGIAAADHDHDADYAPISHQHTESDITDLDHDATKIDGIPVDLTYLADGDALVYDEYTGKIVPGEGGGGGAYAETIGDGIETDYDVVHNLGTEDIIVQLWDLTGADPVEATGDASAITIVDVDTVNIAFASAPDTDSYRVVVLMSGGGGAGGSGDVVGPASATDGHLAVFDGVTGKVIKDGGAVPSGGGGWVDTFTPPDDGDFSWINQGTASVDAVDNQIYLLAPAVAGDNQRIRKKAAPATPYSLTVWIAPHLHRYEYNLCGIGFRESSSGKLHNFQITYSPTAPAGFVLESVKMNSPTSFSALYKNTRIDLCSPICLRISDDGTYRKCFWSLDGKHFHQIHSIGRTDFLTADEIFFHASSINATYPAGVTLLSWKEE